MTRHARLAILLLAIGCSLEEPFIRSNPFDPGSVYPMRIVGAPDTVFSIGDQFQISVDRDPAVPASFTESILWVANLPDSNGAPSPQLKHLFNGRYIVSPQVSSGYTLVAIGAVFNSDVVVWRNMYVGQRAESLSLSCSSTTTLACDTPARAIGARVQVWSKAFDARGNGITRATGLMGRSQIVIRDPTVMESSTVVNSLGNYHFTAIGPGSTWVVVNSDRGTDSVRFVVTP